MVSALEDPPQDQIDRLIGLYQRGELQQTLNDTAEHLRRYPNSILLYNIQGAANAVLRRYDAAIESYRRAIGIRPDYVEAHNNLGIALKDRGDLDAAIESFRLACRIAPDFTEAFNNLGIALKDKGELSSAVGCFERALTIRPDYAEAFNNLGVTLKEIGNVEAALLAYAEAIRLRPDYPEAYRNLALALGRFRFIKPNATLEGLLVRLLEASTLVRPRDIAKAAVSLLKLDPEIARLIAEGAEPDSARTLIDTIGKLARIPLLLQLLQSCPIPDAELEALLTRVRSAALMHAGELTESPLLLQFLSALAQQCFVNEYVYCQTDAESEALAALEGSLTDALRAGMQPRAADVLLLASFKPLSELDEHARLAATGDLEAVLRRTVSEPLAEKALGQAIPTLGAIDDAVSASVRAQYEENPYPRWIHLGLRVRPATVAEIFQEIGVRPVSGHITATTEPEILIAGCGTGEHAIETAARFANARITAVDLSRASLAYAKRKTDELGVRNIEYLHADILALADLGRQFDIVESTGVLHHMDDPLAGWRMLAECLRAGGLMKIGLYSELARQDVTSIRAEIARNGISAEPGAIRRFRRSILESTEPHHRRIVLSNDFYSLSTVRDLLFHVQEHQFTIPRIRDSLTNLGLAFCGFENRPVVDAFRAAQGVSADIYDLSAWHGFEERSPTSFSGMYQFWCQKAQ